MESDSGEHAVLAPCLLVCVYTCTHAQAYMYKNTQKVTKQSLFAVDIFTGQCPKINSLAAKEYPLQNAFGEE